MAPELVVCPPPLSRPALDNLLDTEGRDPDFSLRETCLHVTEPLWASVLPSVKWWTRGSVKSLPSILLTSGILP